MGSTSWAMTTSWALPASISWVTWLRPYLTTTGFFLSTVWPFSWAAASASRRSFLAALSSGRYFPRSLNRMRFWRWRRTYLGHFTKRERSLRTGREPPTPQLLGRFSYSGLDVLAAAFFFASGLGAGFFPLGAIAKESPELP